MQCINPGKVHVTTMHLKRKPIIVKFTYSKLPLRSPGLIDVHICKGFRRLYKQRGLYPRELKTRKEETRHKQATCTCITLTVLIKIRFTFTGFYL